MYAYEQFYVRTCVELILRNELRVLTVVGVAFQPKMELDDIEDLVVHKKMQVPQKVPTGKTGEKGLGSTSPANSPIVRHS